MGPVGEWNSNWGGCVAMRWVGEGRERRVRGEGAGVELELGGCGGVAMGGCGCAEWGRCQGGEGGGIRVGRRQVLWHTHTCTPTHVGGEGQVGVEEGLDGPDVLPVPVEQVAHDLWRVQDECKSVRVRASVRVRVGVNVLPRALNQVL